MFIGCISWPWSRGLRLLHRLIPAHILQYFKATNEKYLLILEARIIFSQDVATQTKTWGIILITIHMRKLICFPFLICTFPMEKKYQLHIQEKLSKIGFESHFFGRSGKFGLVLGHLDLVPVFLGLVPVPS